MSYFVSATDLRNIRFQEQDTLSSILQNIAVLLSTPRGSVPLYREFGIVASILDRPIPVAKVMMIADIREAVEEWEPRVTVLDVELAEDPSDPGKLIPTVEVEINDEQESGI